MLGRGDPRGLLFAKKVHNATGIDDRSPAEPMANHVRECGSQADDPVTPLWIIGPVAEGVDREAARLVDDRAPELSPLPPAIVAGVHPQHDEGAKQAPADFIGRNTDSEMICRGQLIDHVDQCRVRPELQGTQGHSRQSRVADREGCLPEISVRATSRNHNIMYSVSEESFRGRGGSASEIPGSEHQTLDAAGTGLRESCF